MPPKSTRRSSSTRRSRSPQITGSTAIILLLILGAIYLFDAWQEGRVEVPITPQPPLATNVPRLPTAASGQPQEGGGAISVWFTDPLANMTSGGVEGNLVQAIDAAEQTIDLAIYNLSLEDVADALIRAKDRGVQVRLMMKTKTMDNRVPQRMADAGIAIVGDQREGLMHNKFMVIDNQEVWIGSMNFTGASVYKDFNNLVRLRSTRAAQNYTVEFNEMFVEDLFGATDRPATPYPQVTIDGVAVEIYFSPDDGVAEQIVAEIMQAETSIDFMAYSFTSDPIAQAMQDRAANGVQVRGVFDESQVKSNKGGEYDVLQQEGFDVYLDGISGLLHHKVIVIDRQVVITGSYNFSASAERTNDENIVIIHDAGIAQQYLQNFETVYQNAQP